MSDLISRQAAIDAIKELLDSMLETDTIGFYEIENVLFEVPSAQDELDSAYQEGYTYAESKYREYLPKKGEWTDIGSVIRWGCTICHHAYETKYNYCPNCGADMRGEEA